MIVRIRFLKVVYFCGLFENNILDIVLVGECEKKLLVFWLWIICYGLFFNEIVLKNFYLDKYIISWMYSFNLN